MPSTFSPNLRLELIANGEQIGSWGDTTNRNLGSLLEQAIAGTVAISLPDADYTLVARNGAVDQARSAVLIFNGVLTAPRNVIAPSASKVYVVRNNTVGSQNITLKTASGVGVVIPAGRVSLVFCDGTNFFAGMNYLAGAVIVDSLQLNTPLPVTSGGTGGNTQATARTGLGMGTAAGFNVASTNTPNTAVQRDGSGNFAAGTITANLTGNATTSSNATQFGGQLPAFYAKANSSFDWETKFTGSTTSVALHDTYGAGWYRILTSGGLNYGASAIPTATTLNLLSFSAGTVLTTNGVSVSSGNITNIYKLRKL